MILFISRLWELFRIFGIKNSFMVGSRISIILVRILGSVSGIIMWMKVVR